MPRIRISESVMQKAGQFGLQEHTTKLAQLLKRMALLSAIASGNFNNERRRYGSFILTIRNNVVVDINCDDYEVCRKCLGTEFDSAGQDCGCAVTYADGFMGTSDPYD